MSVHGWGRPGRASWDQPEDPDGAEWSAVARSVAEHRIEGLLVIGGFSGYEGVWRLLRARESIRN